MEAATKRPPNRVPTPLEDPIAAGRAGGIRSGEARRARKAEWPRHWLAVLSDEVQEHPVQVARAVLKSKNAAAIASVLQLVQAHGRAELRTLRDIERRANLADTNLCDLLDEVEEEMERRDRLRADVAELERQRRELREAIAAEADAAGFELVDDHEGRDGDALAPAA